MPTRPATHRPPGLSGRVQTTHRENEWASRNVPWRKWYGLAVWKDPVSGLRAWKLREQPFCEECLKSGARTVATDVDHAEPHRGDWSKFIDRDNLRSACHPCHSRKTATEDGGFGR